MRDLNLDVEKQKRHDWRIELMRDDVKKVRSPEKVIHEAVDRVYADKSPEQRELIVRDLMLKPRGSKVRIGNEELEIDTLSESIADSIEQINASGTEDGVSPEAEYFGWIEHGQKIISNMTDGYVTNAELDDRNSLLEEFEQREIDILTCMSLYEKCNLENPRVRKKYVDIKQKLLKLREIRSAIQNGTKDYSDERQEQIARFRQGMTNAALRAKGIVYVHALGQLAQEVSTGEAVLSDDKKRELNIYHEVHVRPDFLQHAWQNRFSGYQDFQTGMAEELVVRKTFLNTQDTQEDVIRKMAILSGRIVEQKSSYSETQISRPQNVDANRYLCLKQIYENYSNY